MLRRAAGDRCEVLGGPYGCWWRRSGLPDASTSFVEDVSRKGGDILYRKVPDLVVSELDTLLPGEYILASAGSKNFQLAGLARDVILCLDGESKSFEQILERIQERHPDRSTGRLAQTLERLVELSILSHPNFKRIPHERRWNERALHSYLTLKVNLLSAQRIAPVTHVLSVLFSARWMRWSMPAMVAAQALFCCLCFRSLIATVPHLDGVAFAWLLAGNYAALVLHELGHASACAANGIRHGPIGFCVYLIYPAFYADVSEAWRLPRFARAVVDAGGMFMSLLCASLCSAIFLLTHQPVWGLIAILCDVTVFFNLNPFIRMDGYWLLSDWLGVQNLMNVNREVSWWLARRSAGLKATTPTVLSRGYPLRSGYVAYYLGFLLFLVYACVQLAVAYLPGLVRDYPGLCSGLLTAIEQGAPVWEVLRAAMYWVGGTLPLLWIALFAVRILFAAIRTGARLTGSNHK